ncbi:hypothetical protein [Nocardioides sp.]|uniref:hypothetical protein n=1 Tax=Nocardioides sp. TaxID=35761 RepID=UPI002B264E11|nr:hypothetical protein [Nocardioides sp.]
MSSSLLSPAAAARGILSGPTAVRLVVDGVDDVLADVDERSGPRGLFLSDRDGVPHLSCAPDSLLARAADRGRRALLTLEGEAPAPASRPTRAAAPDVLTLGGRLVVAGRDVCACCPDETVVVAVVVDLVALTTSDADGRTRHLPVEDFTSPEHLLNAGFLRRCAEHTTTGHQDELRYAVSAQLDRPVRDVAGVSVSDLTPSGVRVSWVDTRGAHVRDLRFPRTARAPDELGELLRRELSAGLC